MTASLIIITGLPATGKTTLAQRISNDFKIASISKDGFKEILFDKLQITNEKWREKLGQSSYALLYYMAEEHLKHNQSIIIESNFNPNFATANIQELQSKYDFKTLQIRCLSEGQTLYQRFKDRAFSPERHLGHCDQDIYLSLKEYLLQGSIDLIQIKAEHYDYDTTNFSEENYPKLKEHINKFLKNT